MNGASVERFELVTLESGVCSVKSLANGQVFHPVVGPAAETEAIHLRGAGLVERVEAWAQLRNPFVIWDVGLGAGATALAALAALESAGGRLAGREVELVSFDRSTAALRFALEHADALGYPRGYEARIDELLTRRLTPPGTGSNAAVAVTWSFVEGDFPEMLRARNQADRLLPPNAIFFDPYSPAVNPEMWTLRLFELLRGVLQPTQACLLTTYSRSTSVRVTLLLAGFFVGLGAATGEKEQTTVATNDPALLVRPLGQRWWNETVRASANAAPLRGPHFSRGPITTDDFDRLRQHPQFG